MTREQQVEENRRIARFLGKVLTLYGQGKLAILEDEVRPVESAGLKDVAGAYGAEGQEVVAAQHQARAEGGQTSRGQRSTKANVEQRDPLTPPAPAQGGPAPACPVCDSAMWDNRATKRNPRAPDFKCKDRSCEGVIWPPKANENPGKGRPGARAHPERIEPFPELRAKESETMPAALADQDDDLPF